MCDWLYDWTPTPDNINRLPDPLRRYIHDLETMANPGGTVQENHILRETNAALAAKLRGQSLQYP